jgi:hypothetical protein
LSPSNAGRESYMPEVPTFSEILSIINLILLVLNVLFAYFLVKETVELRKVETEPEIAIYLQKNSVMLTFWDIVVKNIGKGAAFNISFVFDHDADMIKKQQTRKITDLSFFQGAHYLGPGQEYKSFFCGQELFQKPLLPPLVINAIYLNKNKKKFTNEYVIDPGIYWGTEYEPHKSIDDICENLKDIDNKLKKISENLAEEKKAKR